MTGLVQFCAQLAFGHAALLFANRYQRLSKLLSGFLTPLYRGCQQPTKEIVKSIQTQYVHFVSPVIPNEPIQIHSSRFPDRIPAQPTPVHRVVMPVAVVEQAGDFVRELGGKPIRILCREGACSAEEIAEGVVVVAGAFGTGGGIDESGDVAVAVMRDEVGAGERAGVASREEETAGSAASEIRSPDLAAEKSAGGSAARG